LFRRSGFALIKANQISNDRCLWNAAHLEKVKNWLMVMFFKRCPYNE